MVQIHLGTDFFYLKKRSNQINWDVALLNLFKLKQNQVFKNLNDWLEILELINIYKSVHSCSSSKRINLSPFTKDFRGGE